jgi:hypothetical protein
LAYTVRVDHHHGLVDVRYTGSVTIASRTQAYRETLVLLEQTGCRCILIDYVDALPQAERIADISAFVRQIACDPLLHACRIAFVGRRGQLFNATVEVLAEARHYPFRRFHDRESALEWLGGVPVAS